MRKNIYLLLSFAAISLLACSKSNLLILDETSATDEPPSNIEYRWDYCTYYQDGQYFSTIMNSYNAHGDVVKQTTKQLGKSMREVITDTLVNEYNSDNLLTKSLSYETDGEGMIIRSDHTFITYDNHQNIIQRVAVHGYYAGYRETEKDTFSYVYDDRGNILKEEDCHYEDEVLTDKKKTVSTYDNNNRPLTKTIYRFNPYNAEDELVELRALRYEYNANAIKLTSFESDGHTMNKTTVDVTFNDKGKPISSIIHAYGKQDRITKTNYTYNNYGNEVNKVVYESYAPFIHWGQSITTTTYCDFDYNKIESRVIVRTATPPSSESNEKIDINALYCYYDDKGRITRMENFTGGNSAKPGKLRYDAYVYSYINN